jgi:short-subunit dehydrogenase
MTLPRGQGDFVGRRVVLTGASSGIGRALALRLAKAGARLVLASRNQERLDDLARTIWEAGGEATPLVCDVVQPEQRVRLIDGCLAALGGLDILINNAGVGSRGWFIDSAAQQLRHIMEVNFFAAVELTRLALPHLRNGRRPMIVNVSSAVGRRGLPGSAEYCASKFALTGWSESLHGELAPHGIHVLIVSPGAIQTEFRTNLISDRIGYGPEARQSMTADRCAEIVVNAMRKRRREVVITWQARLLLWMNRWFPRIVDWLMLRHARRNFRREALATGRAADL